MLERFILHVIFGPTVSLEQTIRVLVGGAGAWRTE